MADNDNKSERIVLKRSISDKRSSIFVGSLFVIGFLVLIELALGRGSKVILLTPTHDLLTLRRSDPMWATELPKHADQVRRLAMEYGVGLADSDAAFQRYLVNGGEVTALLSHINHPNALGHQLVTRELLRWFPAQ